MIGVAIRNLVPFAGIRIDDRASDLISGVCLSLFLVMTMMALEPGRGRALSWAVSLIIAVQVVFIVLYVVYVCFRFMGQRLRRSDEIG